MPFTDLYVTRISRLQNRMKKKRYVITETYVHKHSWLILSLVVAFYILDVVAHVFRLAVCDFAFANGDFHMISMWSVRRNFKAIYINYYNYRNRRKTEPCINSLFLFQLINIFFHLKIHLILIKCNVRKKEELWFAWFTCLYNTHDRRTIRLNYVQYHCAYFDSNLCSLLLINE